MYKIDKLSLLSGSDINIEEIGVTIHQPTINEIALVGEERLLQGFNLFLIDIDDIKEGLEELFKSSTEKIDLNVFSDFSILILALSIDEALRNSFCDLIYLIIKDISNITFHENQISITIGDNDIGIDGNGFAIIKDIIAQIFKFDKLFADQQLNVQSEKAKSIAKKLKASREKRNKDNKKETTIFSYYISVLSIGSNTLNISNLCNLTIYQLQDQFERFMLYSQYDQSMKAALAGAKVEIVDWLTQEI